MQTFIVQSATTESKLEKPHFWVLCKGRNSGKPLTIPCPNSFRIETNSEEFKEKLYWMSYALWKSKTFHPYLIGSVIPFIRIGDYKKIVCEKLEVLNQSSAEFSEMVKKMHLIELKEKQFKENLQLIQEVKKAYIHKCFNRIL